MGTEHDRRQFLGLAAGASAVALAGCTGESATDTASATDDGATTRGDPTETRTDDSTTPTSSTRMSTVFHFAGSADTQKHAVANVRNLVEDESTSVDEVVLVANGEGITLLSASSSEQAAAVRDLLDRGVSFRACENSMAAFGIETSDLIDGVETVPAGVGELTKLQARDEFAYIETP